MSVGNGLKADNSPVTRLRMDDRPAFRSGLRLVAALASLGGVLTLMVGVLSAMSMGTPPLNRQPKHDTIILAVVLVPVLQLTCVAVASKHESTRPSLSDRLYAAVIIIFTALVALLAIA